MVRESSPPGGVEERPADPQPPQCRAAGAGVLIVEDDEQLAEFLARQAADYFKLPVAIAGSLLEAEAFLDAAPPRIVLLDMLLPDGDGSDLLLRLQRGPEKSDTHRFLDEPAVVVITAAPSLYRLTLAIRTRVVDLVTKPFEQDALAAAFERLARRLADDDRQQRIRQELDSTRQTHDRLRRKIDLLCKDLVAGYQQLLGQIVGRKE